MKPKSERIFFHIDGDAFFASCEQSTAMCLRGKAVVVGRERGIATAYSYQAKYLGVTRAMPMRDIQKQFPQVVVVSSDYRKYSLFSVRMKRIIVSFGLEVEGDSIDECFVEVGKTVDSWDKAADLARDIQQTIGVKLGLTVSVGVGRSRAIAKIASGMNKPKGCIIITAEKEQSLLYPLSIGRVSGIGGRSEVRLNQHKIFSIRDFLAKDEVWIRENFSKPYVGLYRELSGECVNRDSGRTKPKSISKIRAFMPATNNREQLLSEFARNAELVVSKLRQHSLASSEIVIGMKTYGQHMKSFTIRPEQAVTSVSEVVDLIQKYFNVIYQQGVQYRASYIALNKLQSRSMQALLFEKPARVQQNNDDIESLRNMCGKKFGNKVLATAASLQVRRALMQEKVAHQQESIGTPLICDHNSGRVLDILYLGSV